MMLTQGTMDWHDSRCGFFTASEVKSVLAVSADKWQVLRPTGTVLRSVDTEAEAKRIMDEAKAKAKKDPEGFRLNLVAGQPLQAYQDYLDQVLCERLTGVPTMVPDTFQMQWGKDNEPDALALYEQRTGRVVKPCGFIPVERGPLAGIFGASPDGQAADDGGTEVKCPVRSERHIRCFRLDAIPEEHHPQLEGQLLASGWSWVDFISYDPRMPPHLQLYVKRYTPQPGWAEKIRLGVLRIERDLQAVLTDLEKWKENQ
jgi:hypothetical protein